MHVSDPIEDRLDPLRLGRDGLVGGVRAADDLGHVSHRAILVQPVLVYERVEAALRSVVAELHIFDVVRGRATLLRLGRDLVGRDVDELRLLVDKPFDEPRTGDPIDARMLACDPFHRHPPQKILRSVASQK